MSTGPVIRTTGLTRVHSTGVLVTHEHDIASCCRRTVELRDGCMIRDEPVAERQLAGARLAAAEETR